VIPAESVQCRFGEVGHESSEVCVELSIHRRIASLHSLPTAGLRLSDGFPSRDDVIRCLGVPQLDDVIHRQGNPRLGDATAMGDVIGGFRLSDRLRRHDVGCLRNRGDGRRWTESGAG